MAKYGYIYLFIVVVPYFLVFAYLFEQSKKRIVESFRRAAIHIEAIKAKEYNQISKPTFMKGCVYDFHAELSELSEDLSSAKSRYDEHAFLVYGLIDQLETPVLVFNQKNKLTYANGAFSLLYHEPWEMYRNSSMEFLELEKDESGWVIKNRSIQWQISHSRFIDAGMEYQLLVFTNIGSALNVAQINAWQKIMRVISHEINNSLTPVSSIAENLAMRMNVKRDSEALSLISERCYHLQDFIGRYASITDSFCVECMNVELSKLVKRLEVLFHEIDLEFVINAETVRADPALLEQVMINLIKNSMEAESTLVSIKVANIGDKTNIKIIDNGHGFANLENVFVPLYSTKQQGQGIGLSFCKNIIALHQGTIHLTNNKSKGVAIDIFLPKPNSTSESE